MKFENNTQYSISSEQSEVLYIDENEIVLMQKVVAIFIDREGSQLKIISNKAKYNNASYNTIFENDVKIVYMGHLIESEKLFLDFENNVVTINNNIVYEGINGKGEADNIKIDLKTKNVQIFMDKSGEKVKIKSK